MRATVLALLAATLIGCGPRNKIGDRLIGQDSVTNGRHSISNQNPAPPP
jgi:hypothetical protein